MLRILGPSGADAETGASPVRPLEELERSVRSEFLARGDAVERVMLLRQAAGRTELAILEQGVLAEHYLD